MLLLRLRQDPPRSTSPSAASSDCHKAYEELAARGAEFLQPPADRPYGIEAVMRDNSGNWLVLVEQKDFDPATSRASPRADNSPVDHHGPMRIDQLDHVQLAMPQGREEDAVAFYEGLLGIPLVPKPPHLAVRGGCWFERGDLKVHLAVDEQFHPATKAHPAFIVDGVGELARSVAGAGHRVVDDEPLEGYRRVYVYDPFGNRIELMEPLG